jgi:P4 family phage/plasmid primase-like protien
MADPQPRTWEQLCIWRNSQLDPISTLARLPADDLSAAKILMDESPGQLHFLADSSSWRLWDGRYHANGQVRAPSLIIGLAARLEAAVAAVRREVRQELTLAGTDELAVSREAEQQLKPFEKAITYAAGLRRSAGAGSLLKYLSMTCGADDSVFAERQPRWLNCPDGTYELASGMRKAHDPADMLAYCTDVVPGWGASCPEFWSLLARACGNRPDVAEYLLRVLGYCLLGENPEQLIFFLTGPTKSGKSQLLYIVRSVLGELAHESGADLITVAKGGNRNARTENSVRGKRLVTITETSGFMTIDEGQVKRLTGEPVISVNQHYAKTEIRTPVTFTIMIATNEMPVLTGFDDAMRERVVVVPMGETIPEFERDKHIAARILATEKPAILALLMRACAEYHRTGMAVPLRVAAATAKYAAQQNTVANFIADCCLMCPGYLIEGVPAGMAWGELWGQYQIWARGGSRLGRNEFYEHMARQPGVTRNETSRRFEGIVLNPQILSPIKP